MRILQLIDTLNAGGAERVAVNYANALSTRIEGSYLCTTRKEGPLYELLVPEVGHLFLGRKNTFDLKAVFKLRDYLKKNKIQIVQAHGTSYFIAVLVKVTLPKLILIWHNHSGKSEALMSRKKGILKICSLFFEAIFSVNENLAQWSRNELFTKQVFYIKNFILSKNTKSENLVLEGATGKRIVCVANLRPPKNHGLLLDAFAMILRKEPQATLHLFGTNFMDEYSKIILDITKLQFRGSVFYHGMNPNIAALLHTFDVGVLSSDSEGLPLALLEYAQAGLPVVATDVGQCKEVVNGHATIVDKGNGKAIADAVLSILKNPIPARERALKLQSYTMASFGEKTILNQVISIYEEALSES